MGPPPMPAGESGAPADGAPVIVIPAFEADTAKAGMTGDAVIAAQAR